VKDATLSTPVGGPLMTRAFRVLLAITAIGAAAALWRFLHGLASVSALNDGYPWGVWIAIDVVTGTALGCGGYAVALLAYVLNKGEYHPIVRPAVLTSLLGYGLAMLAVTIDLGRFWELWKVPIYFWRWTHSPQLEVALCVATYVLVLVIELSPAALEKWKGGPDGSLKRLADRTLPALNRAMPFILALGLLLPTMHQSSLGTMMLLPASKLHPLWFTPWLPFLFLVNCVGMGYGIVVLETNFSATAFHRARETEMLAKLSRVAMGVAAFWTAFRVVDVAVAGKLPFVASKAGIWFVAEIGLHVAAIAILAAEARRRSPMWQVRAGILLVLAGALFRVNTYLIAFNPGPQWSYFPAVPELLITFGIVAAEAALYIWAVKTFPILAGEPAGARG
jgi:Ni/Fe-hydrogenase subunit HybB-like protein